MNAKDFTHKMGAHCESGTLTSLLNHAGLDITEPLVFGISNGIFFGYLKSSHFSFPTFIVRNKPGQIRKNIAKRLGVKFYTRNFKQAQEGHKKLDELLEQNIPVATQVDFFYMDYMPQWQRVHINVHFIIVLGKKEGKYIISDSYHTQMTELEESKLQQARFAGGYMAPRGFLYYPLEMPQNMDLKKPIVKGIKKACYNMLKLPVPFVGIKGIYKFAEKVKEWPQLARDEEHLSHEIMKINMLLEDQGTGGAGFRYIYATFLQQASEILNNQTLKEMSKRMMEIGDDWRKISYFVAKVGKKRDLGEPRINELSNMIKKQGDAEKQFFQDLYKAV